MLSAPPNGRQHAAVVEADASMVLAKGYLPVDVKATVHLNRFPLGDIDNWSLARAAYAQSQSKLLYGSSRHEKTWRTYAPWELAYYDALEGQDLYRRELKGFNEFQVKAQGEMVSGLDGGFLAPEQWTTPYFGLLRSFSFIDQLPVTKVNMPARIVHLPKVMGDISQFYPLENAQINSSGFLFGQLSYTARNAKAFVPVSNELMRDAPELADQILRKEGALAHALDRDTQALLGQGGPNPTGLVTMAQAGTIIRYYPNNTATSAISRTAAAHATPSFLQVSQLRGQVHALNGTAPTTQALVGQAHCNGIVTHSRFEQNVLTQAASGSTGAWTDANGRPLWMSGLGRPGAGEINPDFADPTTLMGQIWVLTNILPTNSTDGGGPATNGTTFMIAGWWDMFVLFENLELGFDTTVEAGGFQSDQTLVRLIHRYDCGTAHPEAFAVMAGVDFAQALA